MNTISFTYSREGKKVITKMISVFSFYKLHINSIYYRKNKIIDKFAAISYVKYNALDSQILKYSLFKLMWLLICSIYLKDIL